MDQSERKEMHPSLPPDYVSLAQLRERWLQKQQDQSERKEKHPLLPPDYVSLSQLRERWLQKQREKEMSEKREMEMREKREKEMIQKREMEMREKREKDRKHEEDSKKQQRGAGLSANQNQRRLLKTDWRENKASFGDKGKGKEIVIDGFENKKSDYNKKKKKKKKKKKTDSRRRRFEKGIEIAKEKLESDSDKEFNGGIEGVLSGENSGNGGLRGPAKEMVTRIDSSRKKKFEKGIEVAKEKLESETNREFNGGIMGPNGEIVNRIDPRSGFLRNGDNQVSGYRNRNRKFEKGIEVAKEKLGSETNKEFNGGVKGALSVKNSGNDRLKGPSEEIVNRIDSRSGFSRNGDNRVSGYSSRNRKSEKGIEVAKEKLESETNKEFNGGVKEVLSVESGGNDRSKRPNKEMVNIIDSRSGFSRNGNNRVPCYNSRNKKFEKVIEVAKENFESETINEFNGGIKEVLSVEICGKDWLKDPNEEIVNFIDSTSGFSINGDIRGSDYNSRKKKFEKGIEVVKEKLESETNKEFIGRTKGGLSVENSGNDRLKGPNEEIVNRIDSRSGFWRNGDNRGSGYYSRNKKFEKGVEAAKEMLESETNKELNVRVKGVFSGENSGNDGLKGPTEGFSRNGSNRGTGDNSNRVRFNQLKLTEVNLVSEKKMEDKRGHSRTWREIRRNGSNPGGEGHYRLKENGHYVSKADVVEPKLEKKADNENLEVYCEIGGLNGGDRNGLSNDDHNRVEGEGLNENGSTADKEADAMVLALESVGICEKGGVRNGYRRYGNNGRRFRGGDWKSNVADRGQYARPRRFEGHWKMKERDNSGMMWVKTEDKTGAYDDARVGSSGISAGNANNIGGDNNRGAQPQPHPVLEQLAGIQYCINSPPPWSDAICLGFQHYILALGSIVLIPSMLVPQMGGTDTEKAKVVQTLLFISGINTLLHSFFGTRLPSVIGGSYAFLVPATSIIRARRYRAIILPEQRFVETMREIQGALIVASFFQMAIGFSGLWRNIARLFTPLSIVPLVTFTGLGLHHLGFPLIATCLEVGIPELVLIIIISQLFPRLIKSTRPLCNRYALLLSVPIVWVYAEILTLSGAFSESRNVSCRTNSSGLISGATWLYIPYPFQWGPPTFRAREIFATIVASFVASTESTGSFIAAARYGSATPVPPSVISRGVGWMGTGTLLNALFGSVTGATATVENAGLLALTKAGSRRVVQISSTFMIFFSIFGKLGAIFASIPLPIMAASYCIFFGYVSSAGLGYLQFCNLNSFRTKLVLGFSFFIGLSLPQYLRENHANSKPGWFNDILYVIFMSHATVAALVGLALDRTLDYGSDEARKNNGSYWWDKFMVYNKDDRSDEFYKLPGQLNRWFPSL